MAAERDLPIRGFTNAWCLRKGEWGRFVLNEMPTMDLRAGCELFTFRIGTQLHAVYTSSQVSVSEVEQWRTNAFKSPKP